MPITKVHTSKTHFTYAKNGTTREEIKEEKKIIKQYPEKNCTTKFDFAVASAKVSPDSRQYECYTHQQLRGEPRSDYCERNRSRIPVSAPVTSNISRTVKKFSVSPPSSIQRNRSPQIKHRTLYQRRSSSNVSKTGCDKKSSFVSYYQEAASFNNAAQRIQNAFRKYLARKKYWKEQEDSRRNSIEKSSSFDASYHSTISLTEDTREIVPVHKDPNLGLIPFLQPLDSDKINSIMKDLRTNNSLNDLPLATHLLDETSPCLLLLGGINPARINDYIIGAAILLYKPKRNKWFYCGTMPEPRSYHTAVYLHDKVYIIGGFNPLQIADGEMMPTSTTYQLSVRSRRWKKMAAMHYSRVYHNCAVVDDTIIVVGGRDSKKRLLATAEQYNPVGNQWMIIQPMPEARMGMAVACLDSRLWVIGGFGVEDSTDSNATVLDSVICYDLQKKTWLRKASISMPCAMSSAVTMRRKFWVWGGISVSPEDGNLISVNSVFVYNPYLGVLEEEKLQLYTPKHAVAVAKAGNKIFLFGGLTSTTQGALGETDIYDYVSNRLKDGNSIPYLVGGSTAVAIPLDYMSKNADSWAGGSPDQRIKVRAAVRIQSFFRGHSIRKSLSGNVNIPKQNINYLQSKKRFGSIPSRVPTTKELQSVSIEKWPPTPNPNSKNSSVVLSLGGLPPGYSVENEARGNKSRISRYVPFQPHTDPMLGLVGFLDDGARRTKKVLGLRRVYDSLPDFAHNLKLVDCLQDNSIPVILATGGLDPRNAFNCSYGKTVLKYHPLKDRWEFAGLLPAPRNHHASALLQNTIYVTGGYDPEAVNRGEMVATKTTFAMDISTLEWIQKADMNYDRANHGLVVYKDWLYAVGGRDSHGKLLSSFEVYQPEEDRWQKLLSMDSVRMGLAAVIYENQLWVLGGIGQKDSHSITTPLSSVTSYDFPNSRWLSRPPLRYPRAFGTALVVNNELWMCGGCGSVQGEHSLISMASVDVYNADEAEWHNKAHLNFPRHCAASVAVGNLIYTFGGISSQEWDALAKNEVIMASDGEIHYCSELPKSLTGISAVTIPPVRFTLQPESLCTIIKYKLDSC